MSRCALAAMVLLTISNVPAAGAGVSAKDLLSRVQAYVGRCDRVLEAVVADEHYVQTVDAPAADRRVLDSEFAWLRLPGLSDAIGVRDVRRVDGEPVTGESRLPALLEAPDAEREASVRTILNESARYNLGVFRRNVNFPTFPFAYVRAGRNGDVKWRVESTGADLELRFRDESRHTIVRNEDGMPVPANGVLVIDPASGVIRSCRLAMFPKKPSAPHVTTAVTLSVQFQWNDRLQIAVPATMTERLVDAGRGGVPIHEEGGEAVYSNYRRFETGGRVEPR